MSEEEINQMKQQEIASFINPNVPLVEEKHNTHTFLNRVAMSDDTTKTGFLGDTEVGTPKYPVRTYKKLAVYSALLNNNDFYKNFFLAMSETITASSLSRQGFLTKQATTTTKNVADVTKIKKENKGWFSSKDKDNGLKPEMN